MRLPRSSTRGGRSSASGGNGFSTNACRDLRSAPGPDAPGLFPPQVVVQVKALACELPANLGLSLSRIGVDPVEVHADGFEVEHGPCVRTTHLYQDDGAFRTDFDALRAKCPEPDAPQQFNDATRDLLDRKKICLMR